MSSSAYKLKFANLPFLATLPFLGDIVQRITGPNVSRLTCLVGFGRFDIFAQACQPVVSAGHLANQSQVRDTRDPKKVNSVPKTVLKSPVYICD